VQRCSATGVVRRSEPGHAVVELDEPRRCAGCSGACLWYRVPRAEVLTLPTSGTLAVGAAVTVTLPDRYVLAGAALLYGLPLCALLAGGAVAAAMFGSDLAAACGGLAALLGTLLLAGPLRRRLERATLRRLAVTPLA
jgi:sigma-E factor negative regulatory protein RseC